MSEAVKSGLKIIIALVLIILVVLGGRKLGFFIKDRFEGARDGVKPTPTPTVSQLAPTPTPMFIVPTIIPGQSLNNGQTIPSTGPGLLVYLLIPVSGAGLLLRKR